MVEFCPSRSRSRLSPPPAFDEPRTAPRGLHGDERAPQQQVRKALGAFDGCPRFASRASEQESLTYLESVLTNFPAQVSWNEHLRFIEFEKLPGMNTYAKHPGGGGLIVTLLASCGRKPALA